MRSSLPSTYHVQRGATLFVALTILVLLTLLALSAAQVTGLQERMSGIYRADAAAFQSAEHQLRDLEREILDDATVCDVPPDDYLPDDWFDGSVDLGDASRPYVRIENLNNPSSPMSGGLAISGSAKFAPDNTPGGVNCLVFRVSSLQADNPDEPTSRAIIQSTFIP